MRDQLTGNGERYRAKWGDFPSTHELKLSDEGGISVPLVRAVSLLDLGRVLRSH